MKKILVVDDEIDLCEILRFNLENEGYEVDTAHSAEEALQILSDQHDLILLDVMLEGMSGYQMANKLRTELKNSIPIIFLTAKNTENDLITGFSIGGDDYITKPFSLKEVLVRMKAIARRASKKTTSTHQSSVVQIGNLVIDDETKTVKIQGETIFLTKKEFLILYMLVQTAGRFHTREQILNNVWNDESFVLERTVDVHIARLRKKLGTVGNQIINRAGFGYSFEPDNN
ncbi:MAG TPA: response regulator transcription factor [Paludibacteraceae bacterium]|jgi:two-component system alkaline phosphatase synthesis response regulator PhoP|nr:response regulator transcription factor [Paludibacteraceae bacterium]